MTRYNTKADVIRRTRRAAQLNRGQTKIYKRIKEWEEANIGTGDEEYTITLIPGLSFEEDAHLETKGFPSIALAMRGMRRVYRCGCPECMAYKKDKRLKKRSRPIPKTPALIQMIRSSFPCPANQNLPIKMTEGGFISACKKHSGGSSRNGKFGKRRCDSCEIRNQIKNDKPFTPPRGVGFFEIHDLLPGFRNADGFALDT